MAHATSSKLSIPYYIVIGLTLTAWAGCASAPSRFYTLDAAAPPSGTPATKVTVTVGPVAVPSAILSQTFRDLELIISDNASTDATEQLCVQYAAKDPRIRYYRNDRNRGAAWNHNRVVELAQGEYFKWQCHDDFCDSSLLEKCIAVINSSPEVVLCYPQFIRVDETGERLGFKSSRVVGGGRPYERFRSLIYRRDSCEEIYGVMRAAAVRKTSLIGAYSNSDDIFLADLILRGEFRELQEPLFFYRIHSGQSSSAYPTRASRMAWFKPSTQTGASFPFLTLCGGYISLIWRSPLVWREKARCASILAGWLWHFRHWFTEDIRIVRVYFVNNKLVPWFKRYGPWTRSGWRWVKAVRNRWRRPINARVLHREKLDRWELTSEE